MRPSIVLATVGTGLLLLAFGLLPVTGCGCSKAAAKASACLSNVKQQALGLIQYSADNDDHFPRRDFWIDDVYPYVKNQDVFHDPEFARDTKGAQGRYGYAFNAALSIAGTPPKPETVPLTYESVNPIRNASDKFTSLPKPGRHGGKNAVAYADGHVKRVRP